MFPASRLSVLQLMSERSFGAAAWEAADLMVFPRAACAWSRCCALLGLGKADLADLWESWVQWELCCCPSGASGDAQDF